MSLLFQVLNFWANIPSIVYSKHVYKFSKKQNAFEKQSPYLTHDFSSIRSANFFQKGDFSNTFQPDLLGLALVLSQITKEQTKEIQICDFGGGDLKLFGWIERHRPDLQIVYHFVESPNFIESLFLHFPTKFSKKDNAVAVNEHSNLFVYSQVPEIKFDLIIAGAVIGWVHNPFQVLSELASKSNYLLVLRTLCGEGPSLNGFQRTKVNKKSLALPCWFLNEDELTLKASKSLAIRWDSSVDKIRTTRGIYKFRSFLFSERL